MDPKRLERIEQKVDVFGDKLSSIDKTLERNTASLDYHILRTDKLEIKLEPVEKHVAMMNGVLKFIGIMALIAGLLKTLGILQ